MEPIPSPPDARRVYYTLSVAGAASLAELGVDIPVSKAGKAVAFSCLDWTERRWHLGGALGRAIVDAAVEAGCVRRVPGSRVVELAGSLDRWLDS